MKCEYCGDTVNPNCDWRQGRCPHRPAMIDSILADPYKARFYNLINTVKGWFKNGT